MAAVILSLAPRVVRRFLNVRTKADFMSKFNTFMADRADGLTHSSIMAAAEKAGYVHKPSTLGALLLAIPIGYSIYIVSPICPISAAR